MNRNQDDAPIPSVRLDRDARDQLLDQMDENASKNAQGDYNRALRVARRVDSMVVHITQASGSQARFAVPMRNISAGGMAFLHGHYLYDGTIVDAQVPTADGGATMQVRGRVVRCKHISGMVHEIAVKFEDPLDLSNFAELSPTEEQEVQQQLESLHASHNLSSDAAPRFTGKALVVDASPTQAAVTKTLLGKLGFEIVEVDDFAGATQTIKQSPIDLVIADVIPGDETATGFMQKCREEGFRGLLIATSADAGRQTAETCKNAGANDFLTKPITGQNLTRTVTELMQKIESEGLVGPVHSSLAHDETMKPLIESFVKSSAAYADNLGKAIEASDNDAIKRLCFQLKGEGGAHGFWQITRCAEEAIDLMASDVDDAKSINDQVRKLISVIQRVVTT